MTAHQTVPSSATRTPADIAYRRSWWSLALYPATFVLAFLIGEGLITLLTGDDRDARLWEVAVAGIPAVAVFFVPGVLAVLLGLRARRLGRRDGAVPAMVGAAIGVAFLGLNLVSFVATRIFS